VSKLNQESAKARAGVVLPIGPNEDGDLMCPECGEADRMNYTHAVGVTVHSRREDAEGTYLRTSTTNGIVTVEEGTSQRFTPSRRGSIEIAMFCELCGLKFSLVLRQHKGVTNMFAVHSAEFAEDLTSPWPVGEGYEG